METHGFTEYPRMAANIVGDLFTVDGGPVHRCVKLSRHMRKIDQESIKDGIKGYGIMSSGQ